MFAARQREEIDAELAKTLPECVCAKKRAGIDVDTVNADTTDACKKVDISMASPSPTANKAKKQNCSKTFDGSFSCKRMLFLMLLRRRRFHRETGEIGLEVGQ